MLGNIMPRPLHPMFDPHQTPARQASYVSGFRHGRRSWIRSTKAWQRWPKRFLPRLTETSGGGCFVGCRTSFGNCQHQNTQQILRGRPTMASFGGREHSKLTNWVHDIITKAFARISLKSLKATQSLRGEPMAFVTAGVIPANIRHACMTAWFVACMRWLFPREVRR
jgi:hypothetical protein